MKKVRVKLIVKEFYKQMNPDIWDGSGERPDSFDTHAWEYPLTDAVHLELAFGYDESDGGWKYFCDLVYSSDNSSFKIAFCRLIPCKIDAEGKKYGNYHNHILYMETRNLIL